MPRKNTDKCPSADVVTHALRVLELSDEPVAVVCRDEESRRVRTYVENCLGAPPYNGVLYVSGLPGTGKTLTIRKTLTSLQADRKLRCRTIYLNCLRLTAPGALYWEIYRRVFDDGSSSRSRAKVLNALDAHFLGGESDVSTVLVIDEADSLLGTQTRTSSMNNQEILYRLFSWSAMDTSRLVVIAIANIMDLPARVSVRDVTDSARP
ncbi:MAG: uncharacterized protein KVP18_003048 [Porospora cf. gigantea A]|uniref:uncharacterized protein n=1 Tax=Porospora cf. gigantea A TaxID=2853593 RepID=UPI003559619B|nr:MAG: hypothetical protein KVP18_003048 [Porospora cf. gigantea A]